MTNEPRTVYAIGEAKDNADLILDCVALGYLRKDMNVLDPTYGLGRFWSKWTPDNLTACDLNPKRSPLGMVCSFGCETFDLRRHEKDYPGHELKGQSVDFRKMPFGDKSFAAVVFDPPYKLNGSGGSHASDDGYGVATKGISRNDKYALIFDGIAECLRVTSEWLFVKVMDQVNSGQIRWQTDDVTEYAKSLGCRKVDSFFLKGYREQPEGRRQVHARRNYSTLLVFKAPKVKARAQLPLRAQADYELAGGES